MYQSPNASRKLKRNQRNNPFALGNNNLRVRFRKALTILLSKEYYEGTKYGKIYNRIGADGRSEIYVSQPVLEKRLEDEFINIDDDIVKFLVGPTGVGKTTLIRNVFQVYDRDVTSTNGNLIMYVSFYSMVSYFDKHGDPYIAIEDAILGVVNSAVSFLDGRDYIERLKNYDDVYYKNFYKFIKRNNSHLIQTLPDNSKSADSVKKGNGEKYVLDWLEENKPVDYRMCQLKYQLYLYNEKHGHTFENIILILDDLESLESQYTDNILDYAYHCKKCLQANEGRGYHFKALVSMRNYSFRIEQIRRKTAFRDIQWADVILKDAVPDLSKVIKKRTEYVLKLDEVVNSVDEKEAFLNASECLKVILQKIYGKYDTMLLSLTHNNVFESMTLLFRIITNKMYLGGYEIDRVNQNGFNISARDYHVENYRGNPAIPGNDDVYYALVYGEQKVYFDEEDYYLANIMHYKTRERKNTELLGIYIIQYFIRQGVNMGDASYDGFETVPCTTVISDIMDLYSFTTQEKTESVRRGLEMMMEHLYKGGVLLQSIIEPVKEERRDIHRIYDENMKVYLSLRGNQLYNMLSYNALLLTTYRDDIDTEIKKNEILSMDMTMTDRMLYCLDYINYLCNKEIEFMRSIKDYGLYQEILGEKTAVVLLMEGINQTIKTYYANEDADRQRIVRGYREIEKKMNDFFDFLHRESEVSFLYIKPILEKR